MVRSFADYHLAREQPRMVSLSSRIQVPRDRFVRFPVNDSKAYMCAIPACEEFIIEFCEFPFLSPNSVHASSPFSVNHIFFHWIQWHFWPWFFCSYNFALNSVNFLAPTWSLKKTFCSSPLYSKFPPTDFGEMNNSSLILVKKKRPMLSPKLKNTSSYSAKNLLVLQCNGFENERHQQCMFKCGPSCPSSG